MIKFIALGFTAFAREVAFCRKTVADIPEGIFLFNCHPDHVWEESVNMKAEFGDDTSCSELIALMRTRMDIYPEELEFRVKAIRNALLEADVDGRLHFMRNAGAGYYENMRQVLVFGILMRRKILEGHHLDKWQIWDGHWTTFMREVGIEVIR
jgi:hypothetical protein